MNHFIDKLRYQINSSAINGIP